jgi:hypothetical protein
MGVGMRPAKASRPGELSFSGLFRCGCAWRCECGCVWVKGDGGDAEPAIETCVSMSNGRFMSTSGVVNEAGELPLLESVFDSSGSKRAGGCCAGGGAV